MVALPPIDWEALRQQNNWCRWLAAQKAHAYLCKFLDRCVYGQSLCRPLTAEELYPLMREESI